MILIIRSDLETWAKTYESKGSFPYLVARLVYATSPPSTRVSFPFDTGIYLNGYDGIVHCENDTHHVPAGVSLWVANHSAASTRLN